MAATVWKGFLSFGLISIPIRLFSAARNEVVGFRQLHQKCGTRIRQQLYCPTCERTVERSEIVKGFEYDKDAYVLIDEGEVRKVEPPSSRSMEISEFVRLSDVDPLYFDMSYYVVPEEAGRKAYHLLKRTMEESAHVAVAKVAMHRREYTVIIRPKGPGLALHTMYYPNEIRQVSEYEQLGDVEVRPQEIKLAQQLVESLSAPFQPEKYHDEYQRRLLELIEAKKAGAEVTATPKPRMAPVVDLMEALQRSLAGAERKPPARAAGARAAGEKPRARRARKAAG